MAALLVHLLTNGRYGYFRDELYYIACGRHLVFGYVDQPPLSILLLRLSQLFLGDSLFAIRFLPALAGAAIVALTGIIAREIGGRAWVIALACPATLSAVFYLAVGNFFSMNAFEPLFWMGAVYLLVRIINGGSPTLWLWLGVLLGLAWKTNIPRRFSALVFSLRCCLHLSAVISRTSGSGSVASSHSRSHCPTFSGRRCITGPRTTAEQHRSQQ